MRTREQILASLEPFRGAVLGRKIRQEMLLVLLDIRELLLDRQVDNGKVERHEDANERGGSNKNMRPKPETAVVPR